MKKLWSKMTPEFAEGRRQPDPGVGSDMVPPSVLSGQNCSLDKLHPHLAWCWRGENLMGRISTLISSCVSGRTDVSATLKAAEKYGLACHYMWSAADGPRRLEGR